MHDDGRSGAAGPAAQAVERGTAAGAGGHPRALPRSLALLVAGTLFMENLDGTIITTALPRMARSLRVSAVSLNLVMSAYLLTLAVLIPGSAWAADRYGARRVYTAAIAVFTVASGGCALSTSAAMLVSMRVLQGVGGAMMVPVGRIVVLRATARLDTIRAIAYLTWPALVAPLIAPALGGVIVTHTTWRWIFLVNLPLGIIALAFAQRIVPRIEGRRAAALDWFGLLLSAAAITTLVLVAERASDPRSSWPPVVAGFGSALVLIALTGAHLWRSANPLIDLRVLKIATFRASAAGGSVFRLVIGAMPLLVPLTFQIAYRWSPVRSGLLLLFLFAGNVGIKPLTTPMLRRFGFRSVLLISSCGSLGTFLLFAAMSPHTPEVLIGGDLVLSGVFRSTGFSAYNTIAFADVDSAMTSDASTLFATTQQLAAGLGIALAALSVRIGGPVSRLLHTSGTLVDQYRTAVILLGFLLVVPVIEALLLAPRAGDALTGNGG